MDMGRDLSMVYSTFIEVKVELLGDSVILFLDFNADLADFVFSAIVDAAIIKYELHVIHEVLNALILVILQLLLNRGEIHWVLDQQRIVRDVQFLIVDWVRKNVSLLVALDHGKHPLSGLFPLVENWGVVGNLRHLKLSDALDLFPLLGHFKVLGNLRVLPLELLELSVAHRRIDATLAQLGEHVPARLLPLVHDRLCLHRSGLLGPAIRVAIAPIAVCHGRTAIFKQQVKNFILVLLLSIHRWSDTLFVFCLEVGALVNEELDHLITVMVDGIVNRPLMFSVQVVIRGSQVNQLLYSANVAFPDCIVNTGLAVFVLPVDIITGLVAQEFDRLSVALS